MSQDGFCLQLFFPASSVSLLDVTPFSTLQCPFSTLWCLLQMPNRAATLLYYVAVLQSCLLFVNSVAPLRSSVYFLLAVRASGSRLSIVPKAGCEQADIN
jgi:hypothetical protein